MIQKAIQQLIDTGQKPPFIAIVPHDFDADIYEYPEIVAMSKVKGIKHFNLMTVHNFNAINNHLINTLKKFYK